MILLSIYDYVLKSQLLVKLQYNGNFKDESKFVYIHIYV